VHYYTDATSFVSVLENLNRCQANTAQVVKKQTIYGIKRIGSQRKSNTQQPGIHALSIGHQGMRRARTLLIRETENLK
jgi:hypothetical protein